MTGAGGFSGTAPARRITGLGATGFSTGAGAVATGGFARRRDYRCAVPERDGGELESFGIVGFADDAGDHLGFVEARAQPRHREKIRRFFAAAIDVPAHRSSPPTLVS